MKIATASVEDIRQRMGADATDTEAKIMLATLRIRGDVDTDDIPDDVWFRLVADTAQINGGANARLYAAAPELLAALESAEATAREALGEAHRINAAAGETIFNPAVFQLLAQVRRDACAAIAKAKSAHD